jgi:signal peptidase I
VGVPQPAADRPVRRAPLRAPNATALDPGSLVPAREFVGPLERRRWLLEWLGVVACALVVALAVKVFLFQAFVIPSGSMLPALQIGDRVLVDKLGYDRTDLRRGDIIVFARPPGAIDGTNPADDSDLIKRLIGLPGETVEGRVDGVYIDGVRLEEPWLVPGTPGPRIFGPIPLADNQVFMMGDNRDGSKDSRSFGPVHIDLLIGKAVFRVWPPSGFGRLR